MNLPLIRPGIIHFIGTFFGFDEEKFSNNFSLTNDKIEKGSLSLYNTIKPESEEKMSNGSEILCTTLGIPLRDLIPTIDIPQKYASQVWSRILFAQGIQMSLQKTKEGWGLGYKEANIVKGAVEDAKRRYENSPTSKTKNKLKSGKTYVNMMHKPLADKLADDIRKSKRVLFVTDNAFSAREALPYIFSCGIKYEDIGTTEIISNDKRMVTNAELLHTVPFLLISANFFSLRYHPGKYDLVVLWDVPSILKSVHMENPLPDFIRMSVNDKRKNPPAYYKDLWKVADTFHILREFMEECECLWMTEMESNLFSFVRKVRGDFCFDS